MADDALYTSRGKGFGQIARGAARILESISRVDADTGETVITIADIAAALEQVDDRDHFVEPMAQGLFDLLLRRGGRITLEPERSPGLS